VNEYRRLTDALTARAMLRVGQGKYEDAWQDLLACHRLGRLVAQGTNLIEFLVGVAIEAYTTEADLAFLEQTKPNAMQIARYLGDLRKLPAFPALADKLCLAQRFAFLEFVAMIERHGAGFVEAMAGDGPKDVNPFAEGWLKNVDWDPAMREANKWFDRLAAASREPDHAVRRKKLREFDIDVKLLKNKVAQWGGVTTFLGGKQARGKSYGDTMLCLLFPALLKVQEAADRIRQVQDNVAFAFALEWYRRDQGRYPKTLAALAPKYLKDIPRDAFTGDALIYRPSAKGYLLYGVGANGRDEGGRGYDDDPPGDDVSVRMPLPPLRRK
jgi:hypothetical protein